MQVDQPKFMWLANHVHAIGIEQNSTPVVTLHLRPQIDITHNYERKNRVEILFKDDNTRYFVPDNADLERIIEIHMMHKDAVEMIRAWCRKHLKKI